MIVMSSAANGLGVMPEFPQCDFFEGIAEGCRIKRLIMRVGTVVVHDKEDYDWLDYVVTKTTSDFVEMQNQRTLYRVRVRKENIGVIEFDAALCGVEPRKAYARGRKRGVEI